LRQGLTRRRLMRRAAALSAVATLPGVLAACGDDDDDDGGGGGSGAPSGEIETLKPGTLTVGVDVPYPPLEQGRPPDYEGFEIDLVDRIAEELGLEREYKDTGFDTIFRDLAQDKFDIVIAGSTILPERERVVDFSDPYFLNEQSLLVKKGGDVRSIDDLSGRTVGVQKGTTGNTYARENADAGDLRAYPEIDDAFNALVAGQVDGVIFDLIGTQEAAKTLEGLEVAESYATDEVLAMAFAEDNDALREAANDILTELKQNGFIAELYQKYFRKAPPKEILKATHTPS
jgi:polar amino acid transport system substrate-binding protein